VVDDFGKVVVFTHDDRLTLRAQKHEAGLAAGWWRALVQTGEITGWWNPTTKEHLSASSVPEGAGWLPCQSRQARLSDDTTLHAESAFLEVRLGNLWTDFRSRYRLGLEAVLEAEAKGVLRYTGKARTPKHRQEALRNRLKRHWRVACYEHDLLVLDEAIGRTLLEELKPHDTSGRSGWDTVYLKGFHGTQRKDKPLLVKAYDMRQKHGVPAVKLEVSLRSEYIKRHDMREPQNWLTQPEIQSQIRDTLVREWEGVFTMAPKASAMLAQAVQVQQGELFDFVADTRNTLTDLVRRMETVEERQANIEASRAEFDARLRKLEEHREREW